MRPDVDVSQERHCAVKDFADEHHMSISNAYDRLLERGLESESASV